MQLMRIDSVLHRSMKAMGKLSRLWTGLIVAILGVVLGLLLVSPMSDLTVSMVGILVYSVAILSNPLHGLLLWALTVPFGELYINIPLGQSIPDLSLARFCIALILIVLLAQSAVRRRRLAPFVAADWMAILFVLALTLSVVNAQSEWLTAIQLVFDQYTVPLLVYFVAKNLVRTRQDIDKVLAIVLLFGIYAALYAIYENQSGNILFLREEVSFYTYKESGLHVLRGLLHRSDHFGALFSMVIPLTFYLYLKARETLRKSTYGVVLALLFVATFITYKRTAWFSILASLFVMQLFYPRFRRLFLVLLVVAAVVLGATWNTVSESTVVTSRIQSKVSTWEGRTAGWTAALKLWARQPLLGYGVGSYERVAERARVEDTALESLYLNILFGAGLLGFLPYVAWLLLILRDSVRLFKSRQAVEPRHRVVDRELLVAFWALFLGYLVNYAMTTSSILSLSVVFHLLIGSIVGSQARLLVALKQNAPQQDLERWARADGSVT